MGIGPSVEVGALLAYEGENLIVGRDYPLRGHCMRCESVVCRSALCHLAAQRNSLSCPSFRLVNGVFLSIVRVLRDLLVIAGDDVAWTRIVSWRKEARNDPAEVFACIASRRRWRCRGTLFPSRFWSC